MEVPRCLWFPAPTEATFNSADVNDRTFNGPFESGNEFLKNVFRLTLRHAPGERQANKPLPSCLSEPLHVST